MSKPKSSPSPNPWESLFSSATRPQRTDVTSSRVGADGAADDARDAKSRKASVSASSAVGGYTILIQHSMTPRSQRKWALSSTMAMAADHHSSRGSNTKGPSTTTQSLPSSMASMSLKSPSTARRASQGSWYGMAGPFLVRQTFEELCERCDGSVVFVSVLGTSGVLDVDEVMMGSDGFNGAQMNSYQTSSDDDEFEERNRGNLPMIGKRRNLLQKFRKQGAWVDLSSDPFGWEDDNIANDGCDSSFVQRSSINSLQSIAMAIRHAAAAVESRRNHISGPERSQGKQHKMQQPIPVVFESFTPLLHVHGAEKISMLVKSLGRALPSSVETLATGENAPILSPIVAPILYESLRPSEHRCIEDISDAMIHLNLMDATDNSHTTNDQKSTAVISGVIDMVRRGGGGVGGPGGGKLIHHRVPAHIMRSGSDSLHSMDTRGSCYWILDHYDGDVTEDVGEKNRAVNQSTRSETTTNADQGVSSAPTSRPRIYLQDDDPEFDDFDEEDDLDDDLDL